MSREQGKITSAIVVGGGVVGLSCSVSLRRLGIDTLCIAPAGDGSEASWGNAGHIAVEQTAPLASMASVRSLPRRLFWRGGAVSLPLRDIAAWAPFSCRFLAASGAERFRHGARALGSALALAMPAWRRLVETIGAPDLLVEQGHFVLWESARTAAAGRASWIATGSGTATMRDATDRELAQLAALLPVPPAGASRFMGSGQIADLPTLARAMRDAFVRLGGEQMATQVERLERTGSRVTVRLADGKRLDADAVVVAAGAASADLLRPLGLHVPLIAERGYHIQSRRTDWPVDMAPLVFEDRSMIVTRFRSGLRAASFVEFGRRESPPDPRKWARLRKHVAELCLPFEEPLSEWMGARPTLPDYLPAIGRSRHADNLFYAFGHQHLGLTLAAVTGEAVAALVDGGEPALDLAPFDLRRFSRSRPPGTG